ncbi:outer membrane protein [Thermodesulfobacteriota bacterium]
MKKLSLLIATILASSAFIVTDVVADDWSGPYAGLELGYIFGDADTSSWHTDPEDTHTFSLNGFDVRGLAVGIFGGYMWRVGNDIIIGVEGEWNWANADDKITKTDQEIYTWGAEVEQERDASLRLNVGKQMGDYMLYITGGAAWAEVNIKGFTSWNSEQGTDHDASLQGWTIGAGAEKKINENVHARIQYRYSDYGDETWSLAEPNDVNMGKIEYTNHMFTVGMSYCF